MLHVAAVMLPLCLYAAICAMPLATRNFQRHTSSVKCLHAVSKEHGRFGSTHDVSTSGLSICMIEELGMSVQYQRGLSEYLSSRSKHQSKLRLKLVPLGLFLKTILPSALRDAVCGLNSKAGFGVGCKALIHKLSQTAADDKYSI